MRGARGAIARKGGVGVLLVWARVALALNPSLSIGQYSHTAWKVSQGFSRGVINDVAQTADGFV